MRARIARHNEVISPIGVALALIREQVERIIPGAGRRSRSSPYAPRPSRPSSPRAPRPDGVEVEVTVDPQTNTVRAVATGATELRTQDRAHRADDAERLRSGRGQPEGRPATRSGPRRARPRTPSTAPSVRRRFRATRHPVRVVDADGVVRLHAAGRPGGGHHRRRRPTVLWPRLVEESTAYGDGGVAGPGPAPARRLPHRRPVRRARPAAAARPGPQRVGGRARPTSPSSPSWRSGHDRASPATKRRRRPGSRPRRRRRSRIRRPAARLAPPHDGRDAATLRRWAAAAAEFGASLPPAPRPAARVVETRRRSGRAACWPATPRARPTVELYTDSLAAAERPHRRARMACVVSRRVPSAPRRSPTRPCTTGSTTGPDEPR